MARKNLTANNLKQLLWDTLNDIREGKLPAEQADPICSLAREILRTVRIQVDVANMASKLPPTDLVAWMVPLDSDLTSALKEAS